MLFYSLKRILLGKFMDNYCASPFISIPINEQIKNPNISVGKHSPKFKSEMQFFRKENKKVVILRFEEVKC